MFERRDDPAPANRNHVLYIRSHWGFEGGSRAVPIDEVVDSDLRRLFWRDLQDRVKKTLKEMVCLGDRKRRGVGGRVPNTRRGRN
jgi:hypothetical protein